MNPISERLHEVVVAVCAGRIAEAERALRAIDCAGLHRDRDAASARVWGRGGVAAGFKRPAARTTGRTKPSASEQRATFLRDRYTCCYSHCQRPTVSLEILRLLSTAFPEVLPYHRNWTPLDRHILYWTYSTSLEHLRSFSEIGPLAAAAGNLITSCYECNDIKNYLPIELLCCRVTTPADTTWAGLTEFLPQLRKAVATLTPRGVATPTDIQQPLEATAIENPMA